MRRLALLPALLLAACSGNNRVVAPVVDAPPAETITETGLPGGPAPALAAIDSVGAASAIAELASDRYEGRGTGTPGEQLATAFIAARMQALGLEGGAPDGTFFQAVPLRSTTVTSMTPLTLTPTTGGAPAELQFVEDFIATTDQEVDAAALDGAELVFVGYGIQNEGYTWDDYKGVDVTGKVVVMFVNDPPATEAEPALFQGDTLTYNGRWASSYL